MAANIDAARLEALEKEKLNTLINEATAADIPDIIKRIAELPSETEKNIYINRLSKKLKVSIRSIKKDLKLQYEDTGEESGNSKELSANFPGLVDLALNEEDDIAFIVKEKDKLIITPVWEIEGKVYRPPEKEKLPFKLPQAAAVLKHYEAGPAPQLFDDLMAYLKRFSYLTEEQRLIIALAVFLSYIQDHRDIHYIPIILFFAVPERGKTRTGKAVMFVCYRGIYLVELREANLFRYSQDMQATLTFDIMDLWKKAERSGSEDILLLRYEKYAKVARVLYPEKGKFNDMEHYNIFGPTFMATNQPVHKILDSRCIPIIMPNKPAAYENPTAEKAQALKERLTAWRARVMDRPLPLVETVRGLNGRLWDISVPLIQVCKLVAPDKVEALIDALKGISGQRLEDKKLSTEGQIVQHLFDLSPDEGNILEWKITTATLLDKLNADRPEKYKLTPQGMGKKLKAMGIKTKTVMGYSEIHLNKADFDTLLIEYGIISSPAPVETLLNPTKPLNTEKTTTYPVESVVGSAGNSNDSLLNKSLKKQQVEDLVESSRELLGGREEKKDEPIKVTEVIE